MERGCRFYEFIELFVSEVIDFSSQYGSDDRTAYIADNISGPPGVYPNHTDSTRAHAFRSYGDQSKLSRSGITPVAGKPCTFTSTDYVDLFFERALIITGVQIYETYFPGSIVAIRACYRSQPPNLPLNARGLYWVTIWRADRSHQDMSIVSPEKGFLESQNQARIFDPIMFNIPLVPTDLIRIEADTTRCPYFAQIDAVKVRGYSPVCPQGAGIFHRLSEETNLVSRPNRRQFYFLPQLALPSPPVNTSKDSAEPAADAVPESDCLALSLIPNRNELTNALIAARCSTFCPLSLTLRRLAPLTSFPLVTHYSLTALRDALYNLQSPLLFLPREILFRIFQYLDFRTICRVSSVSRLFLYLSDCTISRITSLNLQAYWYSLKDNHLCALADRISRPVPAIGAARCPVLARETTVRYRSWSSCRASLTEFSSSLAGVSGAGGGGGRRTRNLSSCADSISEEEASSEAEALLSASSHQHQRRSAKLCSLRRLDLSWCGNYFSISQQGFFEFFSTACHNLTTLRLASCQMINDDCILHLVNTCGKLRELDLSACRSVSSLGFLPLCRLIHLRSLNLYRTRVSDQALINLALLCQHLHHLNLGACTELREPDNTLYTIAQHNSGLRCLDLWRCRNISANGLIRLASLTPSLIHLDIGWCSGLESQSSNFIPQLVARCPTLSTLILTAIRSISATDLQAIGESLGACLEVLDILGCSLLSEASLEALLSACPRLRFLDVSYCPNISFSSLLRWRSAFPACRIMSNFPHFQPTHRWTGLSSLAELLPPMALRALPAPPPNQPMQLEEASANLD